MDTSAASTPSDLAWAPLGVTVDRLPPALQAVVAGIAGEAAELTKEPESALERISGQTFLNLFWMEKVQEYHLGRSLCEAQPQLSSEDHSKLVGDYMGFLTAKNRVGQLLLKAQALRDK
jgi:hypothetical protein